MKRQSIGIVRDFMQSIVYHINIHVVQPLQRKETESGLFTSSHFYIGLICIIFVGFLGNAFETFSKSKKGTSETVGSIILLIIIEKRQK